MNNTSPYLFDISILSIFILPWVVLVVGVSLDWIVYKIRNGKRP